MELIVKHVQAKGFKAITDSKIFELYPHTVVSGENSQGKTTIGDAITYCLYGCSLTGNHKIDHLLNKESKEMYVGVTAQIDGMDHIVTRHRKGGITTINVDNRKVTQEELMRILPPRQVFLAIFYPDYFLQLSEGDGRALIGKYLNPISKDTILASLTEHERDLLQKQPFLDVNVYLSELKDDLKLHETDITKDEGALEQYQQDLFLAKREERTEKPINYDQLTDMELELHKLAEHHQSEEQSLLLQKDALLDQKAALWKSQPEQKEVPLLADMMRAIQNPSLMETKELDNKLNELRAEWKYKRAQLEQMESLSPGATCPSCLQIMGTDHIEHIKEQLRQELQQINTNAQSYKHDLERLQLLNLELQNRYEHEAEVERKRAAALIQQIQQENDAARKRHQEGKQEEENRLRNSILQIERRILLAQDDYRLKKEVLEKNVLQLREAIKEIELHNNSCQHTARRIAALEDKVLQLKDNIQVYTAEKQDLIATISAAKAFALKQVELQAAQLTPFLNHVEIKLKEIVKSTGELKDCFKVTYDKKLIGQLSASERIKAALEISSLMKQLSGCSVPVFVDNVESITSPVKPTSGQCIECRVVSGQPLTIQEGC